MNLPLLFCFVYLSHLYVWSRKELIHLFIQFPWNAICKNMSPRSLPFRPATPVLLFFLVSIVPKQAGKTRRWAAFQFGYASRKVYRLLMSTGMKNKRPSSSNAWWY